MILRVVSTISWTTIVIAVILTFNNLQNEYIFVDTLSVVISLPYVLTRTTFFFFCSSIRLQTFYGAYGVFCDSWKWCVSSLVQGVGGAARCDGSTDNPSAEIWHSIMFAGCHGAFQGDCCPCVGFLSFRRISCLHHIQSYALQRAKV